MAKSGKPDKTIIQPTPTYNLANMNEADNALRRAIKLMAMIDYHRAEDERAAIERTISAELELMSVMITARHAPYPADD